MGLRVISHNLKRFNSSYKPRKAFRSYKSLSAFILLLQETHFSTHNHPSFLDKSFKQCYFVTYESKSRGVAILIKTSVMFDVHQIYKDPDSRFVIVKGSIRGKMVTLASVYAHNGSQASYFKKIQVLDKFHSPPFYRRQLQLSGPFYNR